MSNEELLQLAKDDIEELIGHLHVLRSCIGAQTRYESDITETINDIKKIDNIVVRCMRRSDAG